MLTITLSTIERNQYQVLPTTTVAEFLEEHNGGWGDNVVSLNGTILQPGDFYKTFADMGVTGNAMMYVQAPKSNA